MQRLEVSGEVRLIYRSLGVKGLIIVKISSHSTENTLHLLDKDQPVSVGQGTACCFMTVTQKYS